MAVFSPARLIQVLTTLVDRSLGEEEAVSGDGSEVRAAETRFSKHGHRHLELIGRESDGKSRDDIQ
jgi:hypothetical protein